MSNVLSEDKKQQALALGQLGWSLRRIERETGIRRETVASYLKAAGGAIRPPRARGKHPPAKPANHLITGPEPPDSKPANEVTTGSGGGAASLCEPYREAIEQGLLAGRNAMSIWQRMVDQHGFTGACESVKRWVRKQRGTSLEARAFIVTPPGEEAQVDYSSGPLVRARHRQVPAYAPVRADPRL